VRQICAADAAAGGAAPTPDVSSVFDLAGRTTGILGLGDVGARIAQGFGMRVLFTSRRPRSLPSALRTETEHVLSQADAAFLPVPLTPQTRHLIDVPGLILTRQ